MNQVEGPNCTIHRVALGEIAPCSRERCAFWEPGGVVAPSGCAIERLGIDVRVAGLAAHLLDVRERLEQSRNLAEAEAAHNEFSRRIGLEL